MADRLGTLLRRLRKQSGLTQEQVAERSGVSVRTIRRLETGKSTDHRVGTVNLLADALGAGPEDRLRLAATLAKAPPEEAPGKASEFLSDSAPTAVPDSLPPAGSDSLPTPSATPSVTPPAAPVAGPAAAPFAVPAALPAAAPAPVRPPAPRIPDALAGATAELAQEVRRRWQIEEEQRRVHDPFPLPVRWRQAPSGLTDHWENIQRLPPGSAADRVDMSGDLRDVAEVYRRIPSGRLVILGRGGSGKSVLTIRFLLDLLAAPAADDRVPVIFSLGSWDPTATALRDWLIDLLLRDHPHLVQRVSSGSTLAAALVDADLVLPVLDGFDEIAEGLRPDALEALNATSMPLVLTSRREEFAEAVHTAGTPLVWAAGVELADLTPGDLADYLPRTSRPVNARGDSPGDAHRVAREGTREATRGTAGGHAGGHGAETGRTGDRNTWDAVLEALHTQDTPAGRNLAEVLSTPLMVILARTIYSENPAADPAELLDTTRFPTGHALEEHLLAGFVPTVYRRLAPARAVSGPPRRRGGHGSDPGSERVRHWLGYLAHHLARFDDLDQQDLAWWKIGDSLRASTRLLTVMLVCALSITLSEWSVGLIVHQLGAGGPAADLDEILLEGALMGPIAGLAFGSVYWLIARFGTTAFAPTQVRLRLPGNRTRIGRGPVHTFASRFGTVLLGGFVMGVGCACAVTLERVLYDRVPLADSAVIQGTLINMLAFGLIFGSAAGLVFGLMAALEAPLDIASAATPVGLLSANRTTVGRQVLVLVPALTLAIALGGRLVVDLLQVFLGPMKWQLPDALFIGVVGGLGGTFSYALGFTAWGQWVIFSRIWLPMTGNLPWDTVAFLDDAYRRGVLRQTGAVYQFRHSRLQHHLGDSYRLRHAGYAAATFAASTTAAAPAPAPAPAPAIAPSSAPTAPTASAATATAVPPRAETPRPPARTADRPKPAEPPDQPDE
ncbi:helix-turn-helix domain-containing protein [Streptomyces sp. CB01881]|uniref:helix-turn-helix domain-containing protein n=1 Tax=Streptomyces sp. CB01881 TaxID=2078691 RepID=UPI000CDBBC8E|nr:helix-turn-helix domain-containing protein [Streptomyces sp. CB01881]AUY52848.1 XRE family transcriptional regulator [Streptomyces sp. CB01881]TYC70566.1 helix-turn-helix domain-containing protein [Streptomyces sp. CB01881]